MIALQHSQRSADVGGDIDLEVLFQRCAQPFAGMFVVVDDEERGLHWLAEARTLDPACATVEVRQRSIQRVFPIESGTQDTSSGVPSGHTVTRSAARCRAASIAL